jgi:hypothetical protein
MRKAALHISKFKPSIFQGRLDFDSVSKRQTAVLAVEYPLERIAFTILIMLLAGFICAYFYFVAASVFNVIGEKQADAQSANMQGSISSLEQQYFSLSQSLTPQTATALGLSPVQSTTYVYRPGNAAEASNPVHAI